jgi:hypothetical protein
MVLIQIIERINDNAYKANLPGKYGLSVTFNIYNISLFDVSDDSRMNPFVERGNNVIQTITRYLLEVIVGPVTRRRTKKFNEVFNELLQKTWAKVDFKKILNNKNTSLD